MGCVTHTQTPADRVLRVVLLASGAGTLAQAIMDEDARGYHVVALITDRQCQALERARRAGVPAECVSYVDSPSRGQWNDDLATVVDRYTPDYVISAGFMRILSASFLTRFPRRVINTHPALLPSFPGAYAVRDALAYGVKVTGSTIHYVDEGVDTGEIISQIPVPVEPEDSADTLHERIKKVERRHIVSVLHRLAVAEATANEHTIREDHCQ